VTCVICYAEVIERFQGLPHYTENLAATRLFLRQVRPLPLTYPALEQYVTIRRALRPIGQLIGDIDTLIAAEALVRHVTGNGSALLHLAWPLRWHKERRLVA
jgi:predicted nucleic acid-binding protein